MALEQRTDLRLTQKLTLTPQLQLQLKLLQFPQLELCEYIQLELIENPFLEIEEENLTEQETEQSQEIYEELPIISRIDKLIVDDYFDERADDGRDLGYFNPGVEEKPSFELFYSTTSDLSDYLMWQLSLSKAPDDIRAVAEVVIGNIDEDGYLRASDEEIASLANSDIETAKKDISLVQDFDPTGVGARNLRECLLLQIKALMRLNCYLLVLHSNEKVAKLLWKLPAKLSKKGEKFGYIL